MERVEVEHTVNKVFMSTLQDIEYVLVQLFKWKYVKIKGGESVVVIRTNGTTLEGKPIDIHKNMLHEAEEIHFKISDIVTLI